MHYDDASLSSRFGSARMMSRMRVMPCWAASPRAAARLALVAAVFCSAASAQAQFGPQQVITTDADGPIDVSAADLDGDGNHDVLSASTLDNKIAWYENTDGQGSFSEQQVITTEVIGAEAIFAVDLDGDGDQHVLSASHFGDKIAWYENTSITAPVAAEDTEVLPQVYHLTAAYPNPFNPATSFSLTLAHPQQVSVGVFDLSGRRMAPLPEGVLAAGEVHRFRFEAGGSLPSGVYMVRVEGSTSEPLGPWCCSSNGLFSSSFSSSKYSVGGAWHAYLYS